MKHIVRGVELSTTDAGHVIHQLILYKLWSKTLTTSFPTPSIANSDTTVMSQLKELPHEMVSHILPYL